MVQGRFCCAHTVVQGHPAQPHLPITVYIVSAQYHCVPSK